MSGVGIDSISDFKHLPEGSWEGHSILKGASSYGDIAANLYGPLSVVSFPGQK